AARPSTLLPYTTLFRSGEDHHDTLLTMMNLGNSYEDLNRYAEALKVREETFRRQKAALGEDHADTLGSMYNLARSYTALGQHARSEEHTSELQSPDHLV